MTPSGFRVERLGVRPVRRAAFPLSRSVVASPGRGLSMERYRVFCLDGANRILSADSVEANSDAEALSKAARLSLGDRREVWLRDRLIGRIGYPQP